MATPQHAKGLLSYLDRTDGSSIFTHGGYTVVASANGPIEAQRRDENPFEAVLDVVVRPAAGVGGTRERHLEAMLQASLRHLVDVKKWPRCVLQITLQIVQNPTNDYVNSRVVQAQSNLLAFPPLLHAAQLALLSGSVAMSSIAAATVVAISADFPHSPPITNPSPLAANEAQSLHLIGFTAKGALLLAESEGNFTEVVWEAAAKAGLERCQSSMTAGDVESREDGGDDTACILGSLRRITEAKVADDLVWR